jgi:cytidylate kinase
MANPMGDAATAAGVDEGEPSQERPPLPRVIAVDGSAASGKSTVGRRLAAHLVYPFLDTGIMYRAITYAALRRGIDLADDDALARLASSVTMDVGRPRPGSDGAATITVDGEDVTRRLRGPNVEEAVSLVSRVPAVREALVRKQREIAARREIVMAGRDIGTVVLPDADLKIYLDASLEERAARRHREFARLGRDVSEADVLADIRRRDQIDSEREVSPLRPADDAVIVETDGLTLDQVMVKVIRLAEAR